VTAGLVAAVLVLGTAVSIWQALEASKARQLADERLLLAEERLGKEEQAKAYAEEQRKRAQRSFDRAINQLTGIHLKLHSSDFLDPSHMDQARRALADDLVQFMHEITKENVENPILRLETAQAYLHLAGMYHRQYKLENVRPYYDKAIAILESLVRANPLETVPWQELGQSHSALGNYLLESGDRQEAVRQYRRAIDSCRQGVVLNASDSRGLEFLAIFLAHCPIEDLRAPHEAVTLAKRAVELAPDDGGCWATLGMAEYRAGHWKDCIAALRKALEMKPSNSCDLCQIYCFQAMAHWQLGNRKEARDWLKRAQDRIRTNRPSGEVPFGLAAEAAKLVGP
jgi:tetratricopeptide (TPR) repeat protein